MLPVESETSANGGDARSPKSIISTTLLWGLLLVVGALVLALFLRRFDYKQQIVINNFQTPSEPSSPDSKSGVGQSFGQEVSDLFASDVNNIIQRGSNFTGSSYIGTSSKDGQNGYAQPFDGIPAIPVSKSYGIEIQGVEIDQVLKVWSALRNDQLLISGDLIPDSDSPTRYRLQISLRRGGFAQYWTSRQSFAPNYNEMIPAVEELTEHFLKDSNPEIAGRYFLVRKEYSQAMAVFTGWMQDQPSRAEPNLYVAKTLIYEGQYPRAEVFADRALNLAAPISRQNRQRLHTEALIAKATAEWGAGETQKAQTLFTKELTKVPYALNNLGLLYLEKRDYTDAEKVLNQALGLDPTDFGAAVALGQTYEADKKYPQAVEAYDQALRLRPTAPEAVYQYLSSLHDARQFNYAVTYCHSWVGTTAGTDTILTDNTPELYDLCARAENDANEKSRSVLAFYYAEAVVKSRNATVESSLFSDLVDSMPEVLCQRSAESDQIIINASQSKEEISLMAEAKRDLSTILAKRAPDDKKAASLIADCAAGKKKHVP